MHNASIMLLSRRSQLKTFLLDEFQAHNENVTHTFALHIHFFGFSHSIRSFPETTSLNLFSFNKSSSADFHFNTMSTEFRKAARFHAKCTIITIWLACASMPVSKHFNFQPSEWHNRNAPKYQLNRSHQLRFAQSVSFSLPESFDGILFPIWSLSPVPVLCRLGRTLCGRLQSTSFRYGILIEGFFPSACAAHNARSSSLHSSSFVVYSYTRKHWAVASGKYITNRIYW